ncbi:S41 family peptidase [Cesiribacter sp. SM1]|uniref:S41 family peptidase n=1 Tax=Cesiribacter sp. SM1 TaxID=2861196 RepID=UPI001CD2F346|nr:S41 family peptidase [Cesiribacter sp. SM1]
MKWILVFAFLLFSIPTFAQNSVSVQSGIDPRLLRQDLDLLYQQLQLNHPKLFESRSKADADEQLKQISSSITKPMNRLAFHRLIAPFVSGFKDGHIFIDVDFDGEDISQYTQSGGTFFPLEVVIINNRLYCKGNPFAKGALQRGDEILTINREPVRQLLPRLRGLMSADGEETANASLQRLFGYMLWLDGLQGTATSVQYRRGKETLQDELGGISKEDLLKLVFPAGGLQRQLHLYPESSLAVVEINSYAQLAKSKAFIDSCFQLIKSKGIRNVALDLRKNGGGNSAIGDYFLAHVTSRPYSTISRKSWRIGPLLQQLDSTHWMRKAVASVERSYSKEDDFLHSPVFEAQPVVAISDPSLFSPVRLFLFTSARTYSSAHMTALAVKCGGLGTIIGQPTGERLDLTGEILEYILPHSKLTLVIPVASYKAACGRGSDVGVQPDFLVTQRPDDLLEGRDPELAFLTDLLKKNKQEGAIHR